MSRLLFAVAQYFLRCCLTIYIYICDMFVINISLYWYLSCFSVSNLLNQQFLSVPFYRNAFCLHSWYAVARTHDTMRYTLKRVYNVLTLSSFSVCVFCGKSSLSPSRTQTYDRVRRENIYLVVYPPLTHTRKLWWWLLWCCQRFVVVPIKTLTFFFSNTFFRLSFPPSAYGKWKYWGPQFRASFYSLQQRYHQSRDVALESKNLAMQSDDMVRKLIADPNPDLAMQIIDKIRVLLASQQKAAGEWTTWFCERARAPNCFTLLLFLYVLRRIYVN